jgi:hypothetical protein
LLAHIGDHPRRRALAIWVVLAAAYASTLGLHAVGRFDYAGDEPHYLLAAKALVDHGSLDVAGEYRAGAYRDFSAAPPTPEGRVRLGRRYEPHWIGLPLLAAPFYALGKAKAVELFVAAMLALAVALSYLLARRVVPDPWCAGAALAVGLSPPMLALGTAVLPEPVAAPALAGAALLAARLRDGPSRPAAIGCFLLLGAVPWLGIRFVPVGLVIAYDAARSLRRANRNLLALAGVEVAFFSIALLVGLNEALFQGPTPHSADAAGVSATGVSSVGDYAARCWRAAALFLDGRYGLLRWAPILALAFAGAWVLYRAGRERLARAIAGLGEEHGVARLCGAAVLAAVLTTTFFVPAIPGSGFPGRDLVPVLALCVPLVALGLRTVPRIGAVLGIVTVAGSVWLWIAVRTGGSLLTGRPKAPMGPLTDVLPNFDGGTWRYGLTAAILAAAAAPVVRHELAFRRRLR